MVPINKTSIGVPTGLNDPKWNALKATLLTEQHAHNVESKCYRDTTINALTLLYKDKCAICERKRGMELQVDHYRPKKPRNNTTNTQYNQSGYYWLAYTWSNLIPLCSKCNNNKSNKFPLVGWTNTNRVLSHADVSGATVANHYSLAWLHQQEQPLLLHPEQDRQFEAHFSFNNDGFIEGRTPQGIETIQTYKLNRNDLRRERIKIQQNYVTAINAAIDEYSTNGNESEFRGALIATFRRIKKNMHQSEAHSLYHFYIYRYFDYYINSFLPLGLRPKTLQYFNQFKAR